ncbi:MAG: DUF1289 domain-containing protein [Psychromonas sp.]|nr:DUF1289 domain-containing protein [Psychromonas sp.]
MKFSPCTDQCTSDGSFCQGCGRSHKEIRESKALVKKVVAHLVEYGYDDPENFLQMLSKKSLAKYTKIQSKKCR